jgi:FtsP/CotA-like multicopper oxidase with cupredoxin domain
MKGGIYLKEVCKMTSDKKNVFPIISKVRKYDIVAIQINIVINKAGEHNHNGMIFALKQDEEIIRNLVAANPGKPVDKVQPLVIRANVGDTININFENKLNFPTSIHVAGIQYDTLNSDGTETGNNPSSTVQPGEKTKYRWIADREGTFLFNDLGNPVSSETGTNINGLWGAMIVEASGSYWTDPITGDESKSGVYADIHHLKLPDFREFTLMFHDEFPIVFDHNNPPSDPHHGGEPIAHSINYRAEPGRIRMSMEGCNGEECMMSSWSHGDPATPVLHSYIGDPAKIRLIHAGLKETHVFHLHVYQWRLDPNDPNSTIIDSISFGPQETFTIEPLYGTGSLQKTIGDVIFHCHLYPHFEHGMWGLWRGHDVLEDGNSTRKYPDGTQITELKSLWDRPAPPKPTPLKPGYPLFISGTFGKKALRPPLSVDGGRIPTPLEKANFGPNPVPGAAFANPSPVNAPIKKFHIVGIQLPIVYNNEGWHDPQGRIFVLAEDEEDVKAGRKAIEPLVIRANAGDCIDVTFTNKFPESLGGTPFQTLKVTDEAGLHIHLVKFDVLCSDSGANGWNYDSGNSFQETNHYRWYANEELRTVFFHDHLFANSHQQHGVFAALIIEPKGSTYHDPYTGKKIKSGTKAVIKSPCKDFREFILIVHDFALLFDKDGNPLNPPPFPDSDEDPGVMGINYRNEPFQFRKGDPAYVFSSFVHGDPATPLLETYQGDPVVIRLLDGAHEEQHAFNLHGHTWLKEPTDPKSPKVSAQTIGISEAFNIEFKTNSNGDEDILYYFGGLDDLWLGCWGIMRIYENKVNNLIPLPGKIKPLERIKPFPTKTGNPPAKAKITTREDNANIPVRKYDIVAIQNKIVYNSFGDNDPDGLLFILSKDEKAVLKGINKPEPLVIRANLGEYIEINLTNKLPEILPSTEHPKVPVEKPWPASNRVSLHPQNLKYDVADSDGATVGFNSDQTIGPGESITYRWYASKLGTTVLFSFGDVRNHRHRGLYAVLIIEPYGATYHDPFTGKELKSGAQAEIRLPNYNDDYREFVVVAQTGISMFNENGDRIPDSIGADDFEDQGQRGFNYRSERFENRLNINNDVSVIFDSEVHGDPSTSVFRAYVGDPVVFRYAMVGDKSRNTTFAIHGHSWLSQPNDQNSNIISLRGAISVGSTYDINLIGGAGGPKGYYGDFLYRSGVLRWDLESGMWGIFRIHKKQCKELIPLYTSQNFTKEDN